MSIGRTAATSDSLTSTDKNSIDNETIEFLHKLGPRNSTEAQRWQEISVMVDKHISNSFTEHDMWSSLHNRYLNPVEEPRQKRSKDNKLDLLQTCSINNMPDIEPHLPRPYIATSANTSIDASKSSEIKEDCNSNSTKKHRNVITEQFYAKPQIITDPLQKADALEKFEFSTSADIVVEQNKPEIVAESMEEEDKINAQPKKPIKLKRHFRNRQDGEGDEDISIDSLEAVDSNLRKQGRKWRNVVVKQNESQRFSAVLDSANILSSSSTDLRTSAIRINKRSRTQSPLLNLEHIHNSVNTSDSRSVSEAESESLDSNDDFEEEETIPKRGKNKRYEISQNDSDNDESVSSKGYRKLRGYNRNYGNEELWTEDYLRQFEREQIEQNEKMSLFFGKSFPFSNHHPCNIELEGKRFNCTEQYYMWQKALAFEDQAIADAILQADDPRDQKRLSNQIFGFNSEIWDKISKKVMYNANWAKYSQNQVLRLALFMTSGTTLVECNPNDRRWGIGLHIDDPRAQIRARWRGENWLGSILTEIREKLKGMVEFEGEYKATLADCADWRAKSKFCVV